MPRFPVSPYWSTNPNISIYLDQGEEQNPSRPAQTSRHLPEYTCPTCETSSRDTPIHCVSVSPSPPSYSSIEPKAPPSRHHLAVPGLTVETSNPYSKPQAPNRTLQFDPEGRPNVRFRRNAFSPISPAVTEFDGLEWNRKSRIGLGIPEAPFNPDTSPVTPGTAEKRGQGDATPIQPASNLAQRIEEKLWNYTASGGVLKRWSIEIISWSLSAACMAGIIIMLMVCKNKPIPKWPLGLTLNAYISVLAKVASAALLLPVSEALGQLKWSWFQRGDSKKMWDFELFDSASRGPWGSFLLLVRTKGKSLAALGAAVTLFALALDPFFQQVVEYPESWRIQDGHGFISKANGYAPFSQGMELQMKEQNFAVDNTLLGLMYKYFFDNGTEPMPFGKGFRAEVPLVCPNSNCTWPAYETLGVHSECVDASDRVEFRCVEDTLLDWITYPILDPDLLKEATFPNGSVCGWWLKADQPILMTGYDIDKDTPYSDEVLLGRAQPLYDLDSREFMPGYDAKLNNSRNPLEHAIIVSGRDLNHVRQNATPIAHECIVSFCALTIESTYSAGGYVEKVSDIIVNDSVTASPWITATIKDPDNSAFDLYQYFYAENVTITTPNNTYVIDNSTFVLTSGVFDDAFPTTYTLVNSTDEKDAMIRFRQYKSVNPYTRNTTYNPFQHENISSHLDNMAGAFTNLMRAAEIETEMVSGTAWDQVNIVDVRWGWLSLPVGLLMFSAFFLLGTIIRSSLEQDRVGVWKSSAIATLLYGLPDDMQKKVTADTHHGTPRANAKEIKVKWIPQRGWRFSGLSTAAASPKDGTARASIKSASSVSDQSTSSTTKKERPSPPPRWI